MLGQNEICAIVAVKNLNETAEFYENKLGLEKLSDDPRGVYFKSGNGRLLLYESQYGGMNRATSATWHVEDVDGTVAKLKELDVQFEQYDIPYVTYASYDGDIHIFKSGEKAAWFKDPEGNILCVSNA